MNGNEILKSLKTQISDEEYKQYLSKIKYDEQNSSENIIIFLADNIFLANWAKRKYKDKISKIVQKDANKKPEIIFNLKSQQQIVEKTLRKQYDLYKNATTTIQNYTFETFITGECNEFAYKMAKEVATRKELKWNPLLIYGNTGLGKTHLLNAICNKIYKRNPEAKIIYVTAETMFNDYRHRLNNKTMDQFRERFRKCDYLLIDDVQFLTNTDKFQEEFFNTFNEINDKNGGQIIMTSDKPPKLIERLEKRLKSRFDGGMTAKIESPELDTKIKIIKQKCEINKINLSEEIINLLATKIQDNIREIEGIILRLQGQTAILNMPITKDMVKNILKDKIEERKSITFDDIIKEISIEYNIKPSEIRTKKRGAIAEARKIATYIAREITQITFPQIAVELNLKNHSAVSKQIKSIKETIKKDIKLKNKIENLISKPNQRI